MLKNRNQKSLPVRQAGKIKSQNYKSKFKILSLILFFYLLPTTYYLLPTTLAQEQFTYDAKGKRNPFIALVTPDGRLLKLEQEEVIKGILLEGIIYDRYGVSYAIVNGMVVRAGDIIGDYQVLKIQEDKVIFVKEGELQEIELKKEEE